MIQANNGLTWRTGQTVDDYNVLAYAQQFISDHFSNFDDAQQAGYAILKATIHYLLVDDGVDFERKGALKKLLVFFDGIE